MVDHLTRLMAIQQLLRYADGWLCVRMSNTKIVMRHPVHGDRVCWIDGGGKIAIRGGAPITKTAKETP